jgi:hypothetical protein
MPDEEVGGGARLAAVIGPLAALGPSHQGLSRGRTNSLRIPTAALSHNRAERPFA